MGMSKSAKWYKANPEGRRKKNRYNTIFHSSPERRKYRSALVKERRKRGMYGDGSSKDISHTKSGGFTVEKASTNRARNRGKK